MSDAPIVVLVRPADSELSLDDSLRATVGFIGLPSLLFYLESILWEVEPGVQMSVDRLTQRDWGFDMRCGWDNWLLCIDDKAALFMNAKVPGIREGEPHPCAAPSRRPAPQPCELLVPARISLFEQIRRRFRRTRI